MRLATVALIALVMLGTTNAVGQGHPPALKMHRQQAGVLDRSGWTGAQSTEGSFSVKLPCLFNDFSVDTSAEPGALLKAFTVGCLRADRRKFSATRVQYRNGTRDARYYFDKNATGAAFPNARVSRSTYEGMPVIDIETSGGTVCGFLRFVFANEDNFVLTVEAPQGIACQGLDAQSTQFFASLVVAPRTTQPPPRTPAGHPDIIH